MIVSEKDPTKRCSFCQKNLASVRHLIDGPKAAICDECVFLSLEILVEAKVVPKTKILGLLFR